MIAGNVFSERAKLGLKRGMGILDDEYHRERESKTPGTYLAESRGSPQGD